MKIWLGVAAAFIVGVVVGVTLTRQGGGSSGPELRAAPAVPQVTNSSTQVEPVRSSPPGVSAKAPAGTPPVAAVGDAATPAPPAEAPPDPRAPRPFEFGRPQDSGTVQAIDVGDALRKQIDRPSTPGDENQIGDMHRALEREARDDGWAYAMEGELQNSMVTETSTGAFRMEHVECRATICEVRISGRGDQAAAVRAWSETLQANNFSQRLFANMSSTVSNNDRIDAIYILRRPAKKP